MTVSFYLDSTTLSGTASNAVRITIPASKTAAGPQIGSCFVANPGGFFATISTTTNQNYLQILKTDSSNFTLGTNTVFLGGQFEFEIN